MSGDYGGYCNLHGRHLGDECPECPYEAKIAELQSKLGEVADALYDLYHDRSTHEELRSSVLGIAHGIKHEAPK